MLQQVTSRYYAQTNIDEESFLAIFEYRGPSLPPISLHRSMHRSETKTNSVMSYLNAKTYRHAYACCYRVQYFR